MDNISKHKDKLGQSLNIDDFVAYPDYNGLSIGRVVKLNDKMVKVLKVPPGRDTKGTNRYPLDMIKINPKDVTLYLLKNSK